MYTIITGMNGVTYHGFPPPAFGAWNQQILGAHPQYYNIGGTHYNIQPLTGVPQFPQAFPSSVAGTTVPFRPYSNGGFLL